MLFFVREEGYYLSKCLAACFKSFRNSLVRCMFCVPVVMGIDKLLCLSVSCTVSEITRLPWKLLKIIP